LDITVGCLEAQEDVLDYHKPFDITYRDGQISPLVFISFSISATCRDLSQLKSGVDSVTVYHIVI